MAQSLKQRLVPLTEPYRKIEMKTNEVYALTKINGFGPVTVQNFINFMLSRSICELKELDFHVLSKLPFLDKNKLAAAKRFFEPANFANAIREADDALSSYFDRGIKVISIIDDQYPHLLRDSISPPVLLYCKGNCELLKQQRNIAVVGTRNNSQHGAVITKKTVQFFVSQNYTIVSGLALGIDTIAHKATLVSSGKTIAVLVDIENIAPSNNQELAEQILANDGLLVSENHPGIKVFAAYFAKRDRIQSGLSLAVVPIETAKNGGTMHAVKASLQTKRLVFVPDPKRSGYEDTSIRQLEGINFLAQQKEVIAYTKLEYEKLLGSLDQKYRELNSSPSRPARQGILF